jgi:hypothetical protein
LGLLDAISGGLTAATQAAEGQQQGEMQGSQLLRAIMLQQATLAKEQAATENSRANTAFTLHRNQAPVLGDTTYNAAKAGEAGAVAGAVAPIHTQEAINTAAGVAPIHTAEAINTAKGTAPIKVKQAADTVNAETPGMVSRAGQVAQAELPAKLTLQQEGGRLAKSSGDAFIKQNKPLVDSVQPYAQAKNAFAEARQGNPAALKSALIAYASVADPKAQLRQGVMNYVTQVDPSFHGTFEMAVDRLTSGKLPPQVIDNMEKMVDRVHETNRQMYNQRRSAYVSRLPQTDAYIPSTDELFNVPGMSGGTSAPTADPFAAIVPRKP